MIIGDFVDGVWDKIYVDPGSIDDDMDIVTDFYDSGIGRYKNSGEIYKASEFIKRNNI